MRKLRPAISVCASFAAIITLAWLSYWSVRLAYADHLFRAKTLAALQRATRLAPGNAQYYVWRAELEESNGNNPDESLRIATALNPLDSFAWMRRGFRAEVEGRYATAERRLLEAARVDHQFDPRWTLMNYYFRRGEASNFWFWTRKSLEMSYGDLTPIFRLCWQVTQNPEEIRRALPPGAAPLAGFAGFLLQENRVEAAVAPATELVAQATTAHLPLLLSCCERALQQGLGTRAVTLWNAMCSRRFVPGLPLRPDGAVLTNGSFASAPLQQGFDWHVPEIAGIEAHPSGPGMEFTLSGRQPEAADLLWQYVPLLPLNRYRLRFEVQTRGAAPESGLRWRVAAFPGGNPVLAESGWLAGEEFQQQELTFSARDGALARLVLSYERARGTPRLQGSVTVRNLAIEAIR